MTNAKICDGCKKPIDPTSNHLQILPIGTYGTKVATLDFHDKACVEEWSTGKKRSFGKQLVDGFLGDKR